VSLTVNYVSAIADGAYTLHLRIARTNRSTQHWVFEIQQADSDGQMQCVLTGTAMTAARRDTWGANDLPMPQVPAPHTLPDALIPKSVVWLTRYDMRGVVGGLPQVWDRSESPLPLYEASLSQLWVRDRVGGPWTSPRWPPRPTSFSPASGCAARTGRPQARCP